MNIKSIYLGSWFPKTELHLEEFELFLISKKVNKLLSENSAKEYHKKLSPQNIELLQNNGLTEICSSSCDYDFKFVEDGLLIAKKDFNDLRDIKNITKFYNTKLAPCLTFLYSKGAKGMEVIREPGLEKRIFIVGEKNKEKDLQEFFISQKQKVISEYHFKSFSAYYSEKYTFININKPKKADSLNIIEYIILSDEIKKHLNNLLITHRYIWDKAEEIITQSKLKIKDLPKNSDDLRKFSNQVANIRYRIEQMKSTFNYRKNQIDFDVDYFNGLINFKSVDNNFEYIKNLYNMTHMYLNNNISELSSIYNENQQKSLNRLQLLFLVSVVTSFLTLGTFPGARIVLYDATGNLISQGQLISFNFRMLIFYGAIALLFAILLYYLWLWFFRNISARFKK